MKSLTKSDKYAIEFLYNQKKEAKDIAKELGCLITHVNKVIAHLVTNNTNNSNNTEQTIGETKTDKTKNLMIRQTSAKKSNTVSIMTEGAAQLSDEFIKTIPSETKNTDNYIYRRPE
jgi:hypothetical protein